MKRFGVIIVLLISFIGCTVVVSDKDGTFGKELWDDSTFVQKTVDASRLDQNIIKAKVSGIWQEFKLENLPDAFLHWNFNKRKQVIDDIQKGKMPGLAGPHNGIVATYGFRREDTKFKVNNAIKGCGFLPKREKMKEIIKLLKNTYEDDMMKKMKVLTDLYTKGDSIFDVTKQVSLELYASPERGTQTFLNQMTDPTSVIVFMDIPTFKLKTIAYLLHPKNPDLNEYEKDVIEYINLIHSYFHGDFSKEFIAVIYNVIESYNSSPGNENGRGTRMVP
ncbi:MAG: hypothetical protein H8E57_09125 [Candidatus Cloacimonetes bacterium]|nr:hypothetical protein [Candidatus Cloacimonadota bacterium]